MTALGRVVRSMVRFERNWQCYSGRRVPMNGWRLTIGALTVATYFNWEFLRDVREVRLGKRVWVLIRDDEP